MCTVAYTLSRIITARQLIQIARCKIYLSMQSSNLAEFYYMRTCTKNIAMFDACMVYCSALIAEFFSYSEEHREESCITVVCHGVKIVITRILFTIC